MSTKRNTIVVDDRTKCRNKRTYKNETVLQQQRNKENHTHLKEMSSKYAKEHREAINERRRNYGTYDCTCGSLNLLVLNRTTHEKSQKHNKHINIA